MIQKFTINSPEALIRFLKSCVHEANGKPTPRGLAATYQVMLTQARKQWKQQAAANKAGKNRKKAAK